MYHSEKSNKVANNLFVMTKWMSNKQFESTLAGVLSVAWLVVYRLLGLIFLTSIMCSMRTYSANQKKRCEDKKEEQQEAIRKISTCTPVSRSRKVSTVVAPTRRQSAPTIENKGKDLFFY